MNETLRVSAQEASRQASEFVQQMNNSRFVPRPTRRMQAAAETDKLYVHNVGPFAKSRGLGSLGMFEIQACPEGKKFARPLVIQGITSEPYPEDGNTMKLLHYDAEVIADAVMGVGPGNSGNDSFARYGMFVSANEKPNEDELEKARAALRAYYQALVGEMNKAASVSVKDAQETKTEAHVIAARSLGKTVSECPWLVDSIEAVTRAECDNCGTPYKVGIAQCPSCSFILDRAKYEKNKGNFGSKN